MNATGATRTTRITLNSKDGTAQDSDALAPDSAGDSASAGEAFSSIAILKRRRDGKDAHVLRELAAQVAEIAAHEKQDARRDLWRRHNNLERVRPPVYVRHGGWMDEIITPALVCRDPFYRAHEKFLRFMIHQDFIDDDYVIEPWITQRASFTLPPEGHWGVPFELEQTDMEGGAFLIKPALASRDDIDRLVMPAHQIDERQTAENVERLADALGGVLEINIDRAPFWSIWRGDISTDLGYLRGVEQILWDVIDEPELLHKLVSFMRDGILKSHGQAELAGDWRLANHENQSMPYAAGLRDPMANSAPVRRADLWCFMSAQEFTAVSPEQHEEFMLRYQKPIIEQFGLCSYGCCEDLTKKISMLRQLKNLRRIAISPFANVAGCAAQIGADYVCSYRPNPSNTVCTGFDEDNVRRILSNDMAVFRRHGCIADICLKDVQTVQRDPERLRRFAAIAKSVAQEHASA